MRAVLTLLLLGACSMGGPVTGADRSPVLPIAPQSIAPVAQATPTPPARITETIMVEGEPESIELERFAPDRFPVVTYLARADFAPILNRQGGRAIARFVAQGGAVRNEAAYVSVIVPETPTTPEQLWQSYTGPNGWLATNRASIIRSSDDPKFKRFGWVKRAIAFMRTDKGEPIAGELYLGEMAGRPFVVLVHLPMEYLEGYGPRVSLLLKHLAVQPAP